MNNRRYDEDIEIIEIDDYDIEIIEIDDDFISTLPSCEDKVSSSFLSKIRKNLSFGKCAIITTCAVTLVVTLTGVFLLRGKTLKGTNWSTQSNVVYNSVNDNISFELNEADYNTISVNGNYEEKGASVLVDGIDYSDDIIIDSSDVDTSRVGVYHVSYTYASNMNQVKTIYRTINVVDTEAPVITLLGSKVYTMLVNGDYVEEGIIVSDNSNEDLLENVVINNNIDVTTPGVYTVLYTVSDSSGNSSSVSRTVVVKYNYASTSNSILTNSFTDNGVYFTGIASGNFSNQLLLKNKDTGSESIIDVDSLGYNRYKLSLDVTNFSNGTYEFYLIGDSLDPLISNLTCYNRIVRSHIGNKLVTMSYDKNIVNMKVEDFEYQYDVVIDPGHGGADFGATNGYYWEKSINLDLSMYEKKRFEDHGLRVLMLRDTDDNYGITMGDTDRDIVEQKGYAVGYYGAVSKIVYSNHHNSSTNTGSAGWEILVPAGASYEDLSVEHKIGDAWSDMYYGQNDPYARIYTRDYEKGEASTKVNGEVYSFEDYYAVIRIPNRLFGVQNVLYEGAYINNSNDMYWYYNLENYKMLSEAKIKAYVESIGVEYIAP